VVKHRLENDLASAIEVCNERDASVFVDVSCSKDGRVMIVSKNSKSSSEVWIANSDDVFSSFHCVKARRNGVRYFIEHNGGWLYIMHNEGSRNFRVSRCRLLSGGGCEEEWSDFVPEDSQGAVLEDMDMLGHAFYACARQ
jgi:oligopeptidase B